LKPRPTTILKIFVYFRISNNKSKEPAGPAIGNGGGQAPTPQGAALRDLICGGAGVACLVFERGDLSCDIVMLLLQAGEFILPIIGPDAAEVSVFRNLFPRKGGLKFADFLVNRRKLRLQPCDLIVIRAGLFGVG
jgi:hypothetical protein